ncbi:MAG TPA: Trk system potassium transporter TrkA [Saprospiraceae bacterium]|nr:Trk system potassium transporter TrkA [Saprospiraceae bacterium]
MKIVLAGAGDIGFHLAKMLSSEQHDIVLIDTSESVLEYAATHLDVLVIKGDSSSVDILRNAGIKSTDLFIAVTTHESVNLISCILAKRLGAKQTIARASKSEFVQKEQKQIFVDLGIDKIIYPTQLAAFEIRRLLKLSKVTDNFEFEGGKMSVLGIVLGETSPFIGRSLREMDELYPQMDSRPIAVLRGHETILPRSNTTLRINDHVYFITLAKDRDQLLRIIGSDKKEIKKIMVLGGSGVGLETAILLEENYDLTIVDKDKENCKRLVDKLHDSLVIEADPSNIELLKEEGLSRMDAVIAVTPNSETNIIACLMSEQSGVQKTIALVDNTDYTHISQRIGIDTIINKKLIAANNIFRFVRKGQIEAITSLHGVDAEIIEYVIRQDSPLTEKPLRELNFPANGIVAGVIRDAESIVPNGNFQLQVNDKVIVLAMTSSIQKVDDLFR